MTKKTFKVDSIKKEKGANIARVSFTTAGALNKALPEYARWSPQRSAAEMEIKSIAGVGGEVSFSLSKGHLVKLEEKLTAEVIFPGIEKPATGMAQNQPPRPERKIYYVVDKTIESLGK